MRIKACGNCKHCRLDLKALNFGVLIDKCGVTGRHILHRWLGGYRCKAWRAEDVL
jgi:hypothetical protein